MDHGLPDDDELLRAAAAARDLGHADGSGFRLRADDLDVVTRVAEASGVDRDRLLLVSDTLADAYEETWRPAWTAML
ncbi:MAG: hypothetical protein M0P31_17995 [Solirubrobacteraceae bacterium]|nr:hypothetical protein [Solirubrobacteraceae bacterium]